MTSDESPSAILKQHLSICSDLHEILLEENRVMRTTGSLPDEDLLARKKACLPRLDASLERLRAIGEGRTSLGQKEAGMVKEARGRLMQLLMVDRENERLLLKASLPPRLKAAYSPVVPGRVARAYERHAPKSAQSDD